MKWNFLHQITGASRTPDLGATDPDARSLCPLSSTEFVEFPPPQNKIPGYATELKWVQIAHFMPSFRENETKHPCADFVCPSRNVT